MNIEFLISYIALLVSYSWIRYVRVVSASYFYHLEFLHGGLYDVISLILFLCACGGLIIGLIDGGFMACLGYLGIALVSIFVSRRFISWILVHIFGYDRMGVILPLVCAIASVFWMFSSVGII